jgi:hypothetical protein
MSIKQKIRESEHDIATALSDIKEVLTELAYIKSNSDTRIGYMVDNTMNHILDQFNKITFNKNKIKTLESLSQIV